MSDQMEQQNLADGKSPKWVVPVIVVLCVVSLAGLAMAWRASTFAQDSRQALNNDMKTMKQSYDNNLSTLTERLSEAEKTNMNLQGDLSVVVKKLQITQSDLRKARDEAQKIRDDEIQQLSSIDSEMKDQLAMKASNDDVKLVNGQVDVVRTDLDSTKRDLQMARSEMGTLIAKNHDDIETLRRLGERDYVEFTIAAKNKLQKVRDVAIELHSADPKKNQCSIALYVDDKRLEKRNRTINEPIFVYIHGERRPTEVVINKVEKNEVAGYMSFPKGSQQASSSGGGQ
jgi:NACalpha-BTF3-like transcription factor